MDLGSKPQWDGFGQPKRPALASLLLLVFQGRETQLMSEEQPSGRTPRTSREGELMHLRFPMSLQVLSTSRVCTNDQTGGAPAPSSRPQPQASSRLSRAGT